MNSLLLAIAEYPRSPLNGEQAIVISLTCLLVLLIASRTIECPHVGPKMPLPFSKTLFNDISVGGFLGAMSFGHILGTLLSLGFAPYF
jgi:photosystem I subunit 10